MMKDLSVANKVKSSWFAQILSEGMGFLLPLRPGYSESDRYLSLVKRLNGSSCYHSQSLAGSDQRWLDAESQKKGQSSYLCLAKL